MSCCRNYGFHRDRHFDRFDSISNRFDRRRDFDRFDRRRDFYRSGSRRCPGRRCSFSGFSRTY